MSIAVRMEGINKRFGAVIALKGVDLTVEKGSFHAIVGENGAGKTTLMRVLYGALPPDSGAVAVFEQPARFRNTEAAIEAGIGMVSQHYAIIPGLTCLENLMLGAEPGWRISKAAATVRADALAKQMGFAFDWQADAASLSPSGAQKLEILKLLWRKATVMILDEPTAMLSPLDGEALFESLKLLVDQGDTVILVTHRLPEVMTYCKNVTVMRGGMKVADLKVSEASTDQLVSLIVGADGFTRHVRAAHEPGDAVLELKGLTVKGDRGDLAVQQASLTLRAGEVVGIAGVDGNGQSELFQALMGLRRLETGSLVIDGSRIEERPTAERIAAGMRLIPEDRQEEALIETWSVMQNALLGFQRNESLAPGGIIHGGAVEALANDITKEFNVRHGGLGSQMASLSGGNQQRFVAGRVLRFNPRVILAFQPVRGLDIQSTELVYRLIRDVVGQGGTALIVSFDLDELLQYCDRVVTMVHGKLVQPPDGFELDRDMIGRQMVGAA